MTPYKWLFKYLKKHLPILTFNGILTLIYVSFTFLQPIVLGRLVNDVVYGKNISRLAYYAFIVIASIVIKEGVWYLKQHFYESVSQNVVFEIRKNVFRKIENLDQKYFEYNQTGDIMSALTMDTDSVRDLITSAFPNALCQAAMCIAGMVVLFSANIYIGLFILLPTPIIAVLSVLFKKQSKPVYLKIRKVNASLNSVVEESISGNRVVKAYTGEQAEIRKFEKENANYCNAFMESVNLWNKFSPVISFLCNFETIILLATGAVLLIKGYMTYGEFTTASGILWCITLPMQQFGTLLNQFENFASSSLRLMGIENQKPMIGNTHKLLKKGTGINGDIEFKNVTFYHGSRRVLTQLNFSIKAGQTVAVIGPTGSGKSTIVNLIAHFYECSSGTVYIDGINIKNIDIETLRKNVSYAMQDIFLFSDTIKNNISYAVPDATEADIIRVSKIAGAHKFITSLPEGYDTIVGERGVGLSGGQKQRISLARALLKNPAILILDDTTSAIDMETEYEIQNSLKENFRNKTKIIIAHRISSVKDVDLILVINDGHLVEWGNHSELIKQNGYYKSACDSQFGDFNKIKKQIIDFPSVKAPDGGVKK